MKIRNGYVSNSSSSSFVIFNWFDLPEEKRYYIMCYDENVWEIWHKKKIKIEQWKDHHGFMKDYPFYGEEYSYNDNKEKYDFGWINNACRWDFEENKKRNACIVSTSMDNFNMKNWLKFNKVDFESIN